MSLALLALIGVGLYWGLPAYWVYRGEDALKAGRFAEADQYFEQASPWPSQRKASILGRVKVARFSGNPSRALALLTTAQSRGASSAQLEFERALLNIQSGNNASTSDAPQLLVRFPERGSEIMEAVVNRDVQQGQNEQALQHVNDWIQAAPSNARAISYKAELLATSGDMDEAEALFRAAVRQDPQLRRARHGLAKLLKYVGKYQQAVDQFEIEMEREPDNVSLRLLRCDALLQMQQSDQAIEGLLEVLELDQLNFPARHTLASQLAKRGEHARVIEVLTPLRDEFADDASINYLLASAYSEQGDPKRSEQHMQQYLDGRKRLDELAMLTQSLSSESPDQATLLLIANDYLKYQWDVAEPWIVRAIQNFPASREPYSAMATFQRKKGDVETAAQYEQAAALLGT
ncbi:tetratricopeptide repeat protein [Rhodopirellula sp. P2]|uniref:tetratricopeptide repeat protein n=1 Tax=Rhodopirellula sp. P2 TaxID=2127060 RepID=UPI0023683943|nr:tetratricopeptide repeat protein [Rhodopirellula sp. P2]WDQ17976.1 tetratricopeptide repeat protein [Rhodopirellula sp. P2]